MSNDGEKINSIFSRYAGREISKDPNDPLVIILDQELKAAGKELELILVEDGVVIHDAFVPHRVRVLAEPAGNNKFRLPKSVRLG